MRPIIGDTIVILRVGRVVIIGEVGGVIDGMLRHPLFAVSAVVVAEYGRFMALLEAEEKEGLSQEERGSPGAKAPLQIPPHTRTGTRV